MTATAAIVDPEGGVAWIAVELPADPAADPGPAVAGLAAGLDALPVTIRAVVVSATGPAGPDPRDAGACGQVLARLDALALPTVCAIDGPCDGLALAVALCCDVRIAVPTATLSLPAARPPGAGTVERLVDAVGQGVARDLLLSGRTVTADEALAWGLVTRIVDGDGTAADAAAELATRLATLSPEALGATKQLARAASRDAFADGLAAELDRWGEVRAGANAQEGLVAFAEKRAPVFGGPGA